MSTPGPWWVDQNPRGGWNVVGYDPDTGAEAQVALCEMESDARAIAAWQRGAEYEQDIARHQSIAQRRAGVRESLKAIPDPQRCDDDGLDRAMRDLAGDILDDPDEYHALIEEAAGKRVFRDAVCRMSRKDGRLSSDEVLVALTLYQLALDESINRIREETA